MPKAGVLSTTAPKPFAQKGKGGSKVLLPSRIAVHQLLNAAPGDRTMLDYGEMTPSGRNAPSTYDAITNSVNKKPL
jgi:hypothetical protein